jgi:hypothetical protein
MRFIVDLYRYVIFGISGLTIIGTMLLILFASELDANTNWDFAGPALAIGSGVVLLLILSLSGIAILISMHDRHVELVEEAADIATSLRRLADRPESDQAS